MTRNSALQGTWPYPFWIAHRGAGELAPENTMAAFRLGAQHGYRMFECDVKLSADGLPYLLHDNTLSRTTNCTKVLGKDGNTVADADAYTWATLCTLDAGSWYNKSFANEPLPSLTSLAQWCLRKKLMLNIELKPTSETGALTGQVVAHQAATLWRNCQPPPLLTSFNRDALQSAQQAQSELPRGLLLDRLTQGWLKNALDLDCVAVVCQHHLWDKHSVAKVKAAGLRALSYTVNSSKEAQRLIRLKIDGIITDKIDRFSPD